jgi:ferredoxin
MTKSDSNVTRRKFIAVSTAAMASPLLLELASAKAEAATTQPKAESSKSAQSGKVYFINRGCIGCQVCKTFCPAKAIRFGYCGNEIDQKKCIHCGTCYQECPISVISETSY